MKPVKSPIVIVGMQRSGTSALAGALSKLGVSFGQEDLLYSADGNNPEGYFEHRKATILNLRCLDVFQMHPTSFNRLPENWKQHPLAESLRSELKEFLKSEFSQVAVWGIKQPVTSLMLPLYNDVFDEVGITPHYVLCVRNPLETMASEAKLDFGSSYRVMPSLGMRAVGSWLRYTLGAFADCVGRSVSVVPYDELLTHPKGVLESIVARHPDLALSNEAWDKAVGSIRTDLRHNRISPSELDTLPAIVRKTFDSNLQFDDSSPADWAEVLSLHAEFQAWTELMEGPAPSAGKLGLAWIDDGRQCISEVTYIPTGDWQTVRLDVDAPPKTNLSGLLYGWPFRAWIRRSTWRVYESKTQATLRPGLGSSLSFEGGLFRLDGVFEPNQINLTTPGGTGPYELELEFLLESGTFVSDSAAGGLAKKLEGCVAIVEELTRRVHNSKP